MPVDETTKKANDLLRPAIDMFSGADGGGGFVIFRSMISRLIEQAERGDESAKTVLHRVRGVMNLINGVLQGKVA